MQQKKTKTCPFCGHDMEVKKISFERYPGCPIYRWFGNCTNPECVLNTNYESEKEAILAINNRVVDKKLVNYKIKIQRLTKRLNKIYLNGNS